jgi:nitrate reductase gamma subunit
MVKKKILLWLFLLTLLPPGSPTEASWLIDPNKYFNSAHGENSCQDCHEDIAGKDLHPNPGDVSKKRSHFFSLEQCSNCHEETIVQLEKGSHGSKAVKNPAEYQDCIQCHDSHYPLQAEKKKNFDIRSDRPEFSEEDKACMTCHLSVDPKNPESQKTVTRLCFQCHAWEGFPIQKMTAKTVALIDPRTYSSGPHSDVNCLVCHPQAPAFEHSNQVAADCRQCHRPHHEKIARDAHLNVSCPSCLQDIKPVRDIKSDRVGWESERNLNSPLRIHNMLNEFDEAACKRCHHQGNTIGAVAMILPAKSVMCMPCHTATFSVGDTTTVLALLVFLVGLMGMFAYLLTGALPGETTTRPISKFFKLILNGLQAIFSSKMLSIIRALVRDVLLQRRLYNLSPVRWFIHSLIFLPLVFRFFWGITALLLSIWKPEWQPFRIMLDKNHPVTAFLFDLTGFMIIIGVIAAFIRGTQQPKRLSDLPNQDRLALALIGGIILVGFLLEGLRIAMTGWPGGAEFAFVGYGISMLYSGTVALNRVYGYIWYLHAILAGVFVAYLPFSRLIHIIIAPIVLIMNAVSDSDHNLMRGEGI